MKQHFNIFAELSFDGERQFNMASTGPNEKWFYFYVLDLKSNYIHFLGIVYEGVKYQDIFSFLEINVGGEVDTINITIQFLFLSELVLKEEA